MSGTKEIGLQSKKGKKQLEHGTGGQMMGQHKTNPVAIAAKEGRLPPKEKNRISKRQAEQLLMSEMERRLFPSPLREYFRIYREIWERGL